MVTRVRGGYSAGQSVSLGSLLQRSPYFQILIQVFILLALVIPFMSRPYWDDELFSVRTASGMDVLLETFRSYENNMALYYWILHGWMKVFGTSEWATRSLSLLFAILTLFSYQRMVNRYFPVYIGFLSGLILVLNPLFLYYSIEARSYSLLILLSLLSTSLFLYLLERRRKRMVFLYGLTLSAAVYTHYFGALMIPVHALVAVFWKSGPGDSKNLLWTWLIVVLSVSPLIIFKPASLDQVDWISPPSIKSALLSIPHVFGSMGVMLAITGIWFFPRFRDEGRAAFQLRDMALLALVWILLPVAMTYFFSVLVKPIFQDRYFVFSLPAVALLAACVLQRSIGAGRTVHWIIWFMLAVQVLFVFETLRKKGSGFDLLVEYVGRHATEKDLIIAYPFFRADHFRYFLQREAPGRGYLEPETFHKATYLPGGGGLDPDPDLGRLDSLSAIHDRSFLICNPSPREADTRQNRNWLPEIEKLLSRHYPNRDTLVFRADYAVPIRLIVYAK